MMINMDIITFKCLDCMELCLINIANYYRKSYALSFFKTFHFSFLNENQFLSAKLSIGEQQINANVKTLYGITLNDNSSNNINEIYQIELPCIVQTKINLCPWLPQYRLQSNLHFFIILGIDKDNLYIADPINSTKIITILKSLSMNILHKIYYVECRYPYDMVSYKYIYEKSVQCINVNELNESYTKFIEYLHTIKDLDIEYKNKDTHYHISDIDKKIGYDIAGSRNLYAIFLDSINNYFLDERLETIKSNISKSMYMWTELRNILFKSHITKTFELKRSKIIRHIDKIRHLEIDLYNKLYDFYKEKYN